MSQPNKQNVTDEQMKALDAIKLKTYGESKSNFVKLDDGKAVTICFMDWSKKNEQEEFVNMWEEEVEGENGTFKVAVFRVLEMVGDKQEEKLLSVSGKKLFGSIERLLKRGFLILEITKHKGATNFDTVYDVIPVGAGA